MKMSLTTAALIGIIAAFFLVGGAEASDVARMKVGRVEVGMLSEGQSEGNPNILIGLSKADLDKYVPAGKHKSAVAVYLLRTSDGPVLVDTGFGRSIAKNLREFSLTNRDIKKVLITHSHGDHIGGLLVDGKPAFPNATVYISKYEYDWSENARKALEPYKGRVKLIMPGTFDAPGDEVAKGVRPIAAYGHTPGHTMFMLESGDDSLLIWGDLTHAMQVQMSMPGISVTYDSNPEQAAAVRKAVLKYVSERKILVAGMHIPFPGMGKIAVDHETTGGYKFTASER